eukprot:3109722-Pyramimonas_sp.AAC.5
MSSFLWQYYPQWWNLIGSKHEPNPLCKYCYCALDTASHVSMACVTQRMYRAGQAINVISVGQLNEGLDRLWWGLFFK